MPARSRSAVQAGCPSAATITNSGTFTDNSPTTITITTPFVNQGGTIDAESGTLSIQSVNCNWTGGNLEAASERHAATGAGDRRRQRHHSDRHLHRLGCGAVEFTAAL